MIVFRFYDCVLTLSLIVFMVLTNIAVNSFPSFHIKSICELFNHPFSKIISNQNKVSSDSSITIDNLEINSLSLLALQTAL